MPWSNQGGGPWGSGGGSKGPWGSGPQPSGATGLAPYTFVVPVPLPHIFGDDGPMWIAEFGTQ